MAPGSEFLQLEGAQARDDVLAGEHLVACKGGRAQAAFDRGQPLGKEEGLDRDLGRRREALRLQGGQDLGEGSLTLLARGEAALDRPPALLGLDKLAAALRAALPGLALDPEALLQL